jgi:hypothetical protein
MARSTNRKNRVLRAPATTDSCDIGAGEPEGSPFAFCAPFRGDRVLRLRDLNCAAFVDDCVAVERLVCDQRIEGQPCDQRRDADRVTGETAHTTRAELVEDFVTETRVALDAAIKDALRREKSGA